MIIGRKFFFTFPLKQTMFSFSLHDNPIDPTKNYYEILKISRDADLQEIKTNFYLIMNRY